MELLLSHHLKLPRMALYLNFERILTSPELDTLREFVRRRGEREPLQHITGTTSFCGYEVEVNRHVLVPRPETELLAEAGWKLQGLNPALDQLNEGHPYASPPRVLDFGTGTACISIAIASKCPDILVDCVDISQEALAVAERNINRHGLGTRVRLVHSDGFSAIKAGEKYDLIISNPPYISSAEILTLDAEVKDHDPLLALDGGADGLFFYRQLAERAGDFLKPEGTMMLEFGDGQEKMVEDILRSQKWIVVEVCADYNHKPRFLIARKNETDPRT